jgi:hypothetical protein
MVAIISGLNSPPIRRLKRTWEQVNARFMTQLGACEMTIDSNKNFTNYRTTLAKVSPPCVPFIGARALSSRIVVTLTPVPRRCFSYYTHLCTRRQQGCATRQFDQLSKTTKGGRSHPGHQTLAVATTQFPPITQCTDVHRRIPSLVQRSSGHW